MKNKNKRAIFVYLFILSALLLILSELLLNYFGKSLCQAKSCEIVSHLLIIPKTYLLGLALVYFISLLLLTKTYLYTEGTLFLNLLIFLIFTGISADGLFLAKLLFEYKLICYLCFAIAFLIFLIILSYLYLFRGIKFSISTLFFVFLGLLFGLFFAFKITTPELPSISSAKKPYSLIYAEDCPRCKELISLSDLQQINLIPFYQVYHLFKIFDLKSVPILIENQNGTWVIYSKPEDIESKLINNTSTLKNIPCENETQGGLCVLP